MTMANESLIGSLVGSIFSWEYLRLLVSGTIGHGQRSQWQSKMAIKDVTRPTKNSFVKCQ